MQSSAVAIALVGSRGMLKSVSLFFHHKTSCNPIPHRRYQFCQTIWSEDKMFHCVKSVVFSTEIKLFLSQV
jgi:hypothetical protein